MEVVYQIYNLQLFLTVFAFHSHYLIFHLAAMFLKNLILMMFSL